MKFLLGLNRSEIRLMTGFLTGHYPVRARLKMMRLIADANCRFCGVEDETVEHLLCDCEALERMRFKHFKSGQLEAQDFKGISSKDFLAYVKSLKL